MTEMSVTSNSSFQNYSHPDNHTVWTTVIMIIYANAAITLLVKDLKKCQALNGIRTHNFCIKIVSWNPLQSLKFFQVFSH